MSRDARRASHAVLAPAMGGIAERMPIKSKGSSKMRVCLVALTAGMIVAWQIAGPPAAGSPAPANAHTDRDEDAARPAAATAESTTVSSTETRVRELIYVLRGHRVFERNDEWGAAIRELVAMGPPALPELLLELKNSERNATVRGLLFAIRAIDDPRALPFVVEAIPKADKLSQSGSDCGVYFADDELQRFMKEHQNFPSRDEYVSYGRPINEILSTIHRLSGQPLPDLTKQGPHPTWKRGYWQEKWKAENKRSAEKADAGQIQLPSRTEDLVERDGVSRFGPLFPTGPDQRLSPVADVTLGSIACADAPSCLDLDTGRLYEHLEGFHYGREQTQDARATWKWKIQRHVDLVGYDGADLHLWLIANDRWDALDGEMKSGKPFDIGREAVSLTPFDKHPADFKPDRIGTFLFTTREGGRGVLRAYPNEKGGHSRRIEYRLWNRDRLEPRATVRPPRAPSEWQASKVVILKEPGFDNQCLYDFTNAKADVLPASIFPPDALPDMEEMLKRGGLLRNERIAGWARERGIDLATSRSRVGFAGGPHPEVLERLHNGQTASLTLLDARECHVTAEAFGRLTVAHAKEILGRQRPSFQVAHVSPPLDPDAPPATCIFETKSGLIGLLQILKVGDKLSSIGFRYELAAEAEQLSNDNP